MYNGVCALILQGHITENMFCAWGQPEEAQSVREDQFVTHAGDRFYFHSALFKLAAQVRHVDVHRPGLAVEIEAPGFLQELFTAEDEPAVFGEGEEQVEFLGAQVQAEGSEAHFPPGRVNGQVAELQRSRVRWLAVRAPQDGFDARHELTRVEGLGQVVIRAELKPEDLVNIVVTGGEHEDGSWHVRSAQAAADFEAIQPGEHHIQYHQRRAVTGHSLHGRLAILYRLHPEAFALQVQAGKFEDGGFIVNEEDVFVHNSGRSEQGPVNSNQ